jgi:hypothetical protein
LSLFNKKNVIKVSPSNRKFCKLIKKFFKWLIKNKFFCKEKDFNRSEKEFN